MFVKTKIVCMYTKKIVKLCVYVGCALIISALNACTYVCVVFVCMYKKTKLCMYTEKTFKVFPVCVRGKCTDHTSITRVYVCMIIFVCMLQKKLEKLFKVLAVCTWGGVCTDHKRITRVYVCVYFFLCVYVCVSVYTCHTRVRVCVYFVVCVCVFARHRCF